MNSTNVIVITKHIIHELLFDKICFFLIRDFYFNLSRFNVFFSINAKD